MEQQHNHLHIHLAIFFSTLFSIYSIHKSWSHCPFNLYLTSIVIQRNTCVNIPTDGGNPSIKTMMIQGCYTTMETQSIQRTCSVDGSVCVENFNSFSVFIIHLLYFTVLPVVEDTMDHQPFHLDTIAADLLLHAGNKRVLVLPFGAFVIVSLPSEINRRWLVHVSLPLVVAEHHLAIQLQLKTSSQEQVYEDTSSPVGGRRWGCAAYLELQHPRAMPVGHIAPFDKELPFPAPSQRRGVGSIRGKVSRPRDRCGGGWVPPSPS